MFGTIIRLTIFSLLFAFAATAVWAQGDTQRLVVWLKGGQKVYHDLSDQPETTFSEGMLWLKTDKVSINYPLTDVLRYTFEGPMTAIEAQEGTYTVTSYKMYNTCLRVNIKLTYKDSKGNKHTDDEICEMYPHFMRMVATYMERQE